MNNHNNNSMNPYLKFAIMMATSFVIMYIIMFLNVDVFDHIYLSNTRTYMTILMIAPMAITMMGFMWGMYENKKLNIAIMVGAAVVFIAFFTMLRQQTFISDEEWMEAMIPHHSSAIMVSQKAHLKDPEAVALAKEIIEAQEREIAQMKKILYRLENEK